MIALRRLSAAALLRLLLCAAAAALSGCVDVRGDARWVRLTPASEPDDAVAARAYARLTRYAQELGALRTERAPSDAPYTNVDLARNFERIVFFSEFRLENGALVPEETETALTKWRAPIRYQIVGDAVTEADRETYAALSRRLGRVTGLDIREARAAEPDNLLILILSRDGRREAADFLEEISGETSRGLIYRLREDNYAIPCAATVGAGPVDKAIAQGLILIKAETSGLLRESCAHEEFAQALGPGNDFGDARPSIFNDDGEFALLTEHDEYILRVLYDRRLEPGMTREEAMPIARRIIADIRPEG